MEYTLWVYNAKYLAITQTIFVNEWNHHYIRKCKYCETIGGIPEILYFLPEQYDKCFKS